ncbi:MAG: hypothetical protein LC105_06990 [Chitinophagales bacterium]|nr:hypothetical protein [Chitinophagales bacterium]MCZ2393581.1 hypothetical protein [Chitinophagales bacterium]
MKRKIQNLRRALTLLFAGAVTMILYSCNTGNQSEQIVKNDLFSFSIPKGWEAVAYDTSQYDAGDQIYETKQKSTYFKVYVLKNEGDVKDFEELINDVYRYMEQVLWPYTGPGKEVQFLTQAEDGWGVTIPYEFKGKKAGKLAFIEDISLEGEEPSYLLGSYITYECGNSIVIIYDEEYSKKNEAKKNKAVASILDSFQPNCK